MSLSAIPRNVSTQPSSADVSLITELYDVIEEDPSNLEARKVLIQQLIACDWLDAARDAASALLAVAPQERDAQDWLNIGQAQAEMKPAAETTAPKIHDQAADIKIAGDPHAQPSSRYKSLFSGHLKKFVKEKLQNERDPPLLSSTPVETTGNGKGRSIKQVYAKPGTARKVTRLMVKNSTQAVDVAFQDLKEMADWLRSISNQSRADPLLTPTSSAIPSDDDKIREALQKRTQLLISALPVGLQRAATTAQMHIEHEVLHRTYICTETMYGDPVSEIPRERFLVTEDGYPWDMEELAQAITSNGGVMRNPLSRQLFTPNDVKAIVHHPLGRSLAAIQLTQNEFSKGVRPRTVDELGKLSVVMLDDDSADQMEGRHALDEYLAYLATLPEEEQKALDKLRVPARDSHTGQQYDSSIGDAVRDARANRVCIHKIGDFLGQAVKYLQQKH